MQRVYSLALRLSLDISPWREVGSVITLILNFGVLVWR